MILFELAYILNKNTAGNVGTFLKEIEKSFPPNLIMLPKISKENKRTRELFLLKSWRIAVFGEIEL